MALTTKPLALFLLSLFCFTYCFAEENNDRKLFSFNTPFSENESGNRPYLEVGKGVTFMPGDSLFKLNIRFRMQNMAALNFDSEGKASADFQVKRLRLRFEGYMFSPKLTYVIQLGFSGYDNSGLPSGKANIIRDAMIYYLPNQHWSIGFGQTKIQANRARVNSSSALQFVDRSIVNSVFQIDRDYGFFGTYSNTLFSDFAYSLKASVTSGEGRNWGMSSNGGLAYTGRVELFPLGRFKKLGEIIEGDFEREQTPKLMVAGTYSTNRNAVRTDGQRGSELFEGESRNINSVFADLVFKYRGFAFYTDYMARLCKDPIVYADRETPTLDNSQKIYTGQGFNLQTSYIFKKNWEIALRYSQVHPDKKIQNHPSLGYNRHTQYTAGVTKYIIGHSLKAQLDASYNDKNMLAGPNSNGWQIRFQIELGL